MCKIGIQIFTSWLLWLLKKKIAQCQAQNNKYYIHYSFLETSWVKQDSVSCFLSIHQGSTFQQLEKREQMVVNTQCWTWQKIKGNRDGKYAIKWGTNMACWKLIQAELVRWIGAFEGLEVQPQAVNRVFRRRSRKWGRCEVIRPRPTIPTAGLYPVGAAGLGERTPASVQR